MKGPNSNIVLCYMRIILTFDNEQHSPCDAPSMVCGRRLLS